MAVYAIHYCDSSRIVQSMDLYVCEFFVVAFHGSDIESCRMSYNDRIPDSRVGIHCHFAIYDGPKNIVRLCGVVLQGYFIYEYVTPTKKKNETNNI